MSGAITQALRQLAEAREGLWDYADAVLKSINPRNPEEWHEGSAFISTYSDKVSALEALAAEITRLVEARADAEQPETPETPDDTDGPRHTLEGHFYSRELKAFTFRNYVHPDVRYWREMVRLLSGHLIAMDAATFASLAESKALVTYYGRRYIAHAANITEARRNYRQVCPERLTDDLWIDLGVDTNKLCEIMREMLAAYDISPKEVHIWLRDEPA